MKRIFVLCLLVALCVGHAAIAGESGKLIITRNEEKALVGVFPDELQAFRDAVGESGLSGNTAALLVDLIRKGRRTLAASKTAGSPESDADAAAERMAHAEACLGMWVVAIRFVRDTGEEDARKRILEEWNSSFTTNDVEMAFLQMVALGQVAAFEVWEARMVSDDLLKYIRRQALNNTAILDAFVYAIYKGKDEDALLFLKELYNDADHVGITINKLLNWRHHERQIDPDNPESLLGPKELPPLHVDVSKIDTLKHD